MAEDKKELKYDELENISGGAMEIDPGPFYQLVILKFFLIFSHCLILLIKFSIFVFYRSRVLIVLLKC